MHGIFQQSGNKRNGFYAPREEDDTQKMHILRLLMERDNEVNFLHSILYMLNDTN